MKKLLLVAVFVISTFVVTIAAQAQSPGSALDSIHSINMMVYVSCAANGAGEWVALSGKMHDFVVVHNDSNGSFHLKDHLNPMGVSGRGLTTGDKYQGTGGSQTESSGLVGYEYTYVNNFRIIGQGKGNNFTVHTTYHIIVNTDGSIKMSTGNYSMDCK